MIPARNEEKSIYPVLDALMSQTIPPKYVCVVDDGSTDNTVRKIKQFIEDWYELKEGSQKTLFVIKNIKINHKSLLGTPEIAKIFNVGFEVLKQFKTDYILVLGGDTILVPSYVEDILFEFNHNNKLVVCSGITTEHLINRDHVEGSGRLIETFFFRQFGFKYLVNHGWESEILFFARLLGYEAYHITDTTFYGLRKASINLKSFVPYGKGMRAIGYWTPYALGRALYRYMFKQKRLRGGIQLLAGFFSFDIINCDKKLKEFVRAYQINQFREKFDIEDFLEEHFPNFYYGEYMYGK